MVINASLSAAAANSAAPAVHHRRVGIVGGGQLARMMAEAARKIGLTIVVLDPTPGCPAREFADQIVGEFDDAEKLAELAARTDVITLDIEAVSAAVLAALERTGRVVAPNAAVLGIIQDKLLQKEFLARHDLPTSAFRALTGTTADLEAFGIPCVVKTRRHGYDGRGVKVVERIADAAELLDTPCLVEARVAIAKELAIMAARNWHGDIALYPVVEAEFDRRANILDTIQAPACVTDSVINTCRALAERIVNKLDGVGIFGIEFFLTSDGQVLVNEISPRPHNSGHYTIEACATSQFEQHLRAVTDMSLGSVALVRPAASFNLLGEPTAFGSPRFAGLEVAARTPGATVHLYGKHSVKPFRKMGHVTVTGATLEHALSTARSLKQVVKVTGSTP
ncbi:MAG: 5-(carboxyamino)imidazole ribonucleotide synthase [Gammaproteobacteria bacterium]|nr:5-(carboxyamino)imidazole ribonucleotide synthase [Gammaproteobacteria bacterium]